MEAIFDLSTNTMLLFLLFLNEQLPSNVTAPLALLQIQYSQKLAFCDFICWLFVTFHQYQTTERHLPQQIFQFRHTVNVFLLDTIGVGVGFVENAIRRTIGNCRRHHFDVSTIINFHPDFTANNLRIVQNKSAARGTCDAIGEIFND